MKVRAYSLKSFLTILAVFLVVALSGCVYFTQVYRPIFALVLLSVAMILQLENRGWRISRKIAYVITGVLFYLLTNIIGNLDSLAFAHYKSYLLTMVEIIAIVFILDIVGFGTFQDYYVGIMAVICGISLACYWIQLTNTLLVLQLADSNLVTDYMISWYHTWGWTYIFNRNAGPFWEPGAFQGYIVLAILFVLNKRRISKSIPILALLTVTLLTTRSTTGYFLFAILSVYFLLIYLRESIKKAKSKALVVICFACLFILVLLGVYYLLNSTVVTSKFLNTNASYSRRILDIMTSGEIIIRRPFLGYGIMGKKLYSAWNSYGITGNSSGLLASLQFFGIVPGMLYLFLEFRGFCKTFNGLNRIFTLCVIVILFMTESLVMYPVYLMFIFSNFICGTNRMD